MLDSLIGAMVLGIGAISFFALYPIIHRTELRGQQGSKAIHMATRLVEHIQLLKPQNLEPVTLSDLKLIDDGQEALPPPYAFSHIPLDEGSLYSPAQTLPQGTGTMQIEALDAGSKRVTVEIRWKTNGGWGSVKLGTIVGGYR